MVNAILAVEDAGFWIHDGFDVRGMLRAFRANVDAGGISQGGSTITQQLVKLELLDERADARPQGRRRSSWPSGSSSRCRRKRSSTAT